MSALIGHAKAARIVAEAFMRRASIVDTSTSEGQYRALVFTMFAEVWLDAAIAMEQAMREEVTTALGAGAGPVARPENAGQQ